MAGSSGVRKGAWTEEEDNLLRKCIEGYGEQKWYQVPLRAGLNRCRKSCRLRWLNYLKPNIKKGEFEEDEVDLILRLHKLLGNRWALIAGRLPGRTPNDVKNYWNTHIRKKSVSYDKYAKGKGRKIETVNIIRPRPRNFSKNLTWLNGKFTVDNNVLLEENLCKPSTTLDTQDNENAWWENLLAGKEFDQGASSYSSKDCLDREAAANLWDQTSPAGITKSMVEDDIFDEVGQSLPTDLSFDVNLWNLLNTEQESFI